MKVELFVIYAGIEWIFMVYADVGVRIVVDGLELVQDVHLIFLFVLCYGIHQISDLFFRLSFWRV